MDERKYSTLVDALKSVPDPRQPQGKRHDWTLILTLIGCAMLSGQLNGRAIAQWVREHAEELITHLHPSRTYLPSESTLRRALRSVDVTCLEAAIAALAPDSDRETPSLRAVAGDGKAVRGAGRAGDPLMVVALADHSTGRVVVQDAVAQGSSEQACLPTIVAEHPIAQQVVTLDALHTDRKLAQQIVDQAGYYLMIVKGNRSKLYTAIADVFALPPWQSAAESPELQQHRTIDKGHGRIEWRTLTSTTALNAYLDWPAVQQVLRRECRRAILKTGDVTDEITYGITNLPPSVADAAQLEQLWRGHWTIENRVHYVRDVSLGEDACRIHTGNAPHALTVLRNALIALVRAAGWAYMPDALRHYGANLVRALRFVGAIP